MHDETEAAIALEVFARLIEALTIGDRAEILELLKIARSYMKE